MIFLEKGNEDYDRETNYLEERPGKQTTWKPGFQKATNFWENLCLI